jgi:surface antigen
MFQHNSFAKTKTTKKFMTKKYIVALSVAGLTAIGLVASPAVFADRFQDQINELSQQNSQSQGNLNQLGSEAASLQDTIAKLQAEIANLQTQITANEQKRDETVAQIAQAEADLQKQRDFLSESLKAMYVDGDISSLEMLASSQNINDFVDQEQYQNSIQGQIQRTLDTIKQLKSKLDADKATLERMIADLSDMRAKVAAQQAEQNRLLSLNQAQQAELDNQIKANSSKIADLRKQQAMENARLGGGKIPPGIPGGGGYPGKWAFAPIDSIVDSWGMYNRECVSWTAFKVYSSGRYMPYWGGRGNANQWDDNARAAGIPVDGSPRVGDVAVSNAGRWGHVMYVEAVGGDGSIYVSDYNQQFDGNYREYWISASTVDSKNLVFIHF